MAYDWNWLTNAYQSAYGAGQNAWAPIQAGYRQRYADVMGNLSNLGSQAQEDIRAQYRNAQNRGMQELINRGLGASTVTTAMRRGYERDQAAALSSLREQLRREQLGYQTSLSGEALAAQERQQAQAPQLNDLLSAQQAQSAEQLANKQFGLQEQRFGLESELGRGQLTLQQQQARVNEELARQQQALAQQRYGLEASLGHGRLNLDRDRLAYSQMPYGGQQQASSGYQLGQNWRIPRAWMGYA